MDSQELFELKNRSWDLVQAEDFINFNPYESMKRGTKAVKVSMDKLSPFNKFISSFERESFSGGSKFRNGDTIMARITPCLENGKTSFVDFLRNDEVAFGSTEFIVMRAKEKKSDPQFVYYLAINPDFRNTAIKSMVGTSGRQRVQQGVLNELKVPLPTLEEQRKIGRFLSHFDEKIRINRRINDNLAEQGQQILSYFMDKHPFQLTPLGDIALVIDCLHSKKPLSVGNSIHQLIQLENIRDDGFLDMSACKYMISNEDYENWTRKCEIIEGDCVITNVGRIGAISQAPKGTKAAMGRNMTCIRLKPNQGFLSYFITVFLSNHMRRQIQCNTDEGTIMGALNVKNIPKLLIPVFSSSLMMVLENMLHPIRKQIEYNNLQNQRLADLRDALLPRLMSGELDVSEVEL